MNLKFKGKSAIISGGSGGMGLAIVDKLIKAKIRILIIDIKEPPKKILNNKLISFAKIDLTEFVEIKKAEFMPNSVLIFPRTNYSYHGVSSINIGSRERNLLLLK